MQKKRVIAVLILRDGKVVQSEQFNHTNLIHTNASVAVEFFDGWSADEIVVLDVSRNESQRDKFIKAIDDLSSKCFVPLTVGGWVKSVEDVRALLRVGADKVVINTEAVLNPELIQQSVRTFGTQCIVVSIDVRKNQTHQYEVFIDRGRTPTGKHPVEWALEAQKLGAGEIFLTSIEHEGMRHGYDLDLLKQVTDVIDIPVIAFGGVSTWEHMAEGILQSSTDAVAAANVLHYTEGSLRAAKQYLKKMGIDVR